MQIYKIWIGPNPVPEVFKKYTDTWAILSYNIIDIGNEIIDEILKERNSTMMEWAVEKGNYTVINHYIRYWLLWKYGGIYMDLDVQVVRDWDFVQGGAYVGMESERWINNHVMVSTEPEHWLFSDLMQEMDEMSPNRPEIELDTGPRLITNVITENTKFKYRFINDPVELEYYSDRLTVMPERCLSGHRWYQKFDPKEIKEDTYAVHHYLHSWK